MNELEGIPSFDDLPPVDDKGKEAAATELQRGALPSVDHERPYALKVVAGPDVGREVVVDGRTLVGTSPVCGLVLSDRTVSRRHAALEPTSKGLRVTDLESTNGTRVGGILSADFWVTGGETIELGATQLRIESRRETAVVLPTITSFGRVVGASRAMRRTFVVAERAAASSVPVLIEGETGTGKEALAEAIHELGPRKAGPFVVVDCTAVAPSLIEAELFGHERGAFTGAVASRMGLFEEAHGGTLFIDEIGDLELPLQAKLLRAIERGEIRRVGESKWRRLDVRIISATRRDLDKEIQEGRFRDDLFFRLAVARIELPPLRKRAGDVALLTQQFWGALGGDPAALYPAFVSRLESYNWPGNVRELQNAVARTLAFGDALPVFAGAEEEEETSTPRETPAARASDIVEQVLAARLPFPRARQRMLAEFERRYVERVLAECRGNIGEAAKVSGIARRYFQMLRARLPR